MEHSALYRLHPWMLMLWITACICLSFFSLHPILAPLSLGCAFLLILLTYPLRTSGKFAGLSLVLIAIPTLFNALFVDLGATILYTIGPLTIHLESLCWGATFGCLLAAITCWGCVASAHISTRQLMGTVGKAVPTLTLCIMMILHTMTRLVHEGRAIYSYVSHAKPWLGQIRRALITTNTLFGNALEASLVTSLSMRARGYGIGRFQQQTTSCPWGSFDVLCLAGLLMLTALCGCCAWLACTQFYFYPTIPRLKIWIGYLPLAVLYLAPLPRLILYKIRQRRLQCVQ